MTKRDYYQVLEISRTAPTGEIRRAYRRLARRYSPDVNLGAVRFEDLFEEIREAFRILGDPASRSLYDRLGHRAFGPAREASGTATVPRGDDIHYPIELDLEEAVRGVTAEIETSRLGPCAACGASGGTGGAAATPCPACQGRSARGPLDGRGRSGTAWCSACQGAGWQIPPPCPACRGRGVVPEALRLAVTVPAGVDTGGQVRIPGEGHVGAGGGPRGDLIVITRVRAHPVFTRKGDHLHCAVPVTMPEAALGARIEIPTPEGPVRMTIPAGVQSGQTIRLRGRGCPRLEREGHGDLLVEVRVVTPRNPDPALEEVLQALRRLLPDDPRAELWNAVRHRGHRAEGGR